MPIKPEKITLSDVQANAASAYSAENPDVSATNLQKATAQILNTIRDNASANYQNYVPELTAGDDTALRQIGAIIMDLQPLRNEFLTALMNRIGRVLITSKMFYNPWAGMKKGLLEFGETVEEIFVNIAKPYQFDPAVAESEVFKREIPDVRAAFHIMNYQKFYKQTISNDQLRQAFLSWQGITDLIAKIVDAMYTGSNYDEFLTMKYLIARNVLDGRMHVTEIAPVSAENAKTIVSTIKGVSGVWQFPSTQYNLTGVTTFTDARDQMLIMNAKFNAVIDVEVLASAFNMEKAEFMGNRILVDTFSFSASDNNRLAELFANDPNFVPLTEGERTALDAIPAVMVDRDWFMVFDNFYNFTENYNGQGLYWNYFYHTWKTFSVSPFVNNTVYVGGAPTVTSVTVSPKTATVNKGQLVKMSATVVTTNFAPKSVTWTVAGGTDSTIDIYGNLVVGENETGSKLTVTATSTFDSAKTDTATITVSA